MWASFLITLREGLEISIVVSIIAAYLIRSGRSTELPAMWTGVASAVAVCVGSGIAFHWIVGDFEGTWEQAIEGSLALVAVGVLTWMIFWMRANATSLSPGLRDKVDTARDRSPAALGLVAFVAVAREGFETILFLLGAETESTSGATVVAGGLAGLVAAGGLGIALYRGSARVDLRRFFAGTGLLLILFAAGLVAAAVHELRELLGIEGTWTAETAWNITSGPLAAGSTIHDFLHALFGWDADPERIAVLGYLGYLLPVSWLFFRSPVVAAVADQPVAESDRPGSSAKPG